MCLFSSKHQPWCFYDAIKEQLAAWDGKEKRSGRGKNCPTFFCLGDGTKFTKCVGVSFLCALPESHLLLPVYYLLPAYRTQAWGNGPALHALKTSLLVKQCRIKGIHKFCMFAKCEWCKFSWVNNKRLWEMSQIGLKRRIGIRLMPCSVITVFLPATCALELAHNQDLLCSPHETELMEEIIQPIPTRNTASGVLSVPSSVQTA